MPAVHDVHDAEPAVENEPPGHGVHELRPAPPDGLYVFDGHAEHGEAAPASEYRPEPHDTHTDWPLPLDVPAEHGGHELPLTADDAAVPGEHALHPPEPDGANVPAPHGEQ